MEKLIIDPEFRDKIPPLTDAEFQQLRENILEDGEVYEPIITWNNTIVDGHNRWTIICENWELLKDKYRTKQMDFANKWAAVDWMCKKQLGRRNLSNEHRLYLIGKQLEARSKSVGNTTSERNADGTFQNLQSEGNGKKSRGTAAEIAKENDVSWGTVERAGRFAKGVDALEKAAPGIKDVILSGKSGISNEKVGNLRKADENTLKEIAMDIISGEIKEKRKSNGWTKADRASRAETEAIIADMLDPATVPEYTADSLVDEIRLNSEQWVMTLRNMLADRSAVLTPKTRPMIAEAITKYVMNEFEKVRDLVK